MNTTKIVLILSQCQIPGKTFHVQKKGDGYLLQLRYKEACVHTGSFDDQHSRKWYISSHATETEIVETAFLCAVRSAEHQVKEHFTYHGLAVFNPHFQISDRMALAEHPENLDGRKAVETEPESA